MSRHRRSRVHREDARNAKGEYEAIERIAVEKEAVAAVPPAHDARLLTCARVGWPQLGFLPNWNVRPIEDGVTRLVHDL